MTGKKKTIWTVARISEHLGVDRHRVEYVIDSRGVNPIGRAGIARVYDDAAVEWIGSELVRIVSMRDVGLDGRDSRLNGGAK